MCEDCGAISTQSRKVKNLWFVMRFDLVLGREEECAILYEMEYSERTYTVINEFLLGN